MISDILKKALRAFGSKMNASPEAKEVLSKAAEGAATYKDANRFSSLTGRSLSDVMADALTEAGTMTEADARALIPGMLQDGHDRVMYVADAAQKRVFKEAGVGLQPAAVEFNAERAESLAEQIRGLIPGGYNPDAAENIRLSLENFIRGVLDDAIKANAKACRDLGLRAIVTRDYDDVGLHGGKDPCQWCLARAGTWTYDEANANDVFSRHKGCGCTITYYTERDTQIQTDWASNTWTKITP